MALMETKPAIRSSRIVEARALARASAARLIASTLLPDVFKPRRFSSTRPAEAAESTVDGVGRI
jgi:hypothetical protein